MAAKISHQAETVVDDLKRFTNGEESPIVAGVASVVAPTSVPIDTRPFKGRKLSSKIANVAFRPLLVALKKSLSGTIAQADYNHAVTLRRIDEIESLMGTETAMRTIFDEKVYEVEKLIDRLKSEIMAEINKDQSPVGVSEKITTKIIDKKKYQELKKLNLGSGSFFKEGYVNVDHREIKGVDVIADISKLPYEAGQLEEIYLSHVAEHFTHKKITSLLQYWDSLLSRTGALVIVVPDIESMVHQFERKEISWDNLRAVILGGQDYNSDYHFNAFSVDYMKRLVKEALPQADVEVIASARKNGECLELEVKITK